jgi:predicted ATPase/DNA-binding CsgD family transcriptional regulator
VERARSSELPTAVTRLVGREHELVELRHLLARTRLLTLVGAGGVGKTRLAVELAGRVLADYADGVRLVQLAGQTDGRLVPQTVAVACEVRDRSARPMLEQLAQILRTQHLLLVLDNCEHLLDACAAVAETLLETCPGVRILATSRERLGLAGETSWRVPSLVFPWPQAPPAPARLEDYPALQLFMERAAEVSPGFAITSEADAATLAAICYRLDGIPLALELAASRLPTLSLQELAGRLDDRFRLLTGGRRAGLARHQTLRTSLDWSHDLLTPAERAAFRRLSVFAGGWALDAAETLLGEGALDLLARLVDKSLVHRWDQRGTTRYAFLETIRAYAAELLAAAGEEAAWRERHAAYYLAFAEKAGPGVRTRDQQRCVERLDAEHDNLRAAARWFGADPTRAHDGLRLAAALWDFWQVRGYLGEAARWLESALEADPRSSPARARALDGLGVMTALRGDTERAGHLFVESAELFEALGDRAGQAEATGHAALTAAVHGDPTRGVALGHRALALARASGDRRTEGLTRYQLGWASRLDGNPDFAIRCSAEAAALAGEVGDRRGRAFALGQLGGLLLEAGRVSDALEPLREATSILGTLGDAYGLALVLSHLIAARAELGDVEAAARLLGAGQALRARIGAELLPPFQQVEEHAGAIACAGLGRAAFDAVVARGRGMSLEQLLAELSEAPVPAGPAPAGSRPAAVGILTQRERDVADLIIEGLTNRQIGDRLVIAERTVDTHVQHILAKLGCATRTQVALILAAPER